MFVKHKEADGLCRRICAYEAFKRECQRLHLSQANSTIRNDDRKSNTAKISTFADAQPFLTNLNLRSLKRNHPQLGERFKDVVFGPFCRSKG